MAIKPGTHARLIQPEVKGVVKDTRWVKERNSFECLLEFVSDGEVTQRWFDDDLLQPVKAPASPATPETPQ